MMRNISILCVVVIFLAGFTSAAEKNYKDMLPEQIKALSKKESNSKVPVIYLWAAGSALSEDSEKFFALQLNTLAYPAISDYEKSIKLFQKDLNEKATGKLTVFQIHKLNQRYELQKVNGFTFPDSYFSHINNNVGVASVHGTWKLLDENIAFPINHVEVYCDKRDLFCEVRELIAGLPKAESWSQSVYISKRDVEFYDIKEWTENSILAVLRGADSDCRKVTFNFNFSSKEFFQITTNGSKACEFNGKQFPKLEKPRVARIVNGEEIFDEEFNKMKAKAFSFLSTDFRKSLKTATQ